MILFILAMLGLCHQAGFSLVAMSLGHSLVAAQALLIAAFSFAAESRVWGTWASVLTAPRLRSCGAWAQQLCSMSHLLGPRVEPVSPALAARFFTTVPPGKPHPP